jgi:hypothetical protein
MTTTAPPTTPTGTVVRRARLGTVGAVLWTLSSGVWAVSEIEDQRFGSLGFVAVAVAWWICMVVAPLLLVLGHTALAAVLGPVTGRIGRAGVWTAAAGLAAMGLGIGIEVASMSAGGGEVSLGHAFLLLGFLVAIVGGVLLGIVVFRRRTDGLSRAAGLLLALALPLGIGLGMLGSAVDPENDAWFWAAITVPTGIAWLLLGASLRSGRRPAVAHFATAS